MRSSKRSMPAPTDAVVRAGTVQWIKVGYSLGRAEREHIFPLDDYRPHEIDLEGACWCRPEFDAKDPGLVIHNAMDGREAFETGARLMS